MKGIVIEKIRSNGTAKETFQNNTLDEQYSATRYYTEFICEPLANEDYVVQPVDYVSPPKWHLAHTTWFFEEFILSRYYKNYKRFHHLYSFLFNGSYENTGPGIIRSARGNMSRPTVDEVFQYRAYVDEHMHWLLQDFPAEAVSILETGLNHEQRHQELLYADIKFILGHNPIFPPYKNDVKETPHREHEHGFINIPEGKYTIGHSGPGFVYDNEKSAHIVLLRSFNIRESLVTNGEFLQFMQAGGYQHADLWLSDGWSWVNENQIKSPLYWHFSDGMWCRYSLSGLERVTLEDPVTHISFYEAAAFAQWKGMRLPTEFEWEAAANQLRWGLRWEHTDSAYLPYPGYTKPSGEVNEYNGKFMVNSMVLRGASVVTPENHSRKTYRMFSNPQLRWQFNGIRLCK